MPSEPRIDLLQPLTRLAPGRHPGGIWVDPIYRNRGYDDALPDVWLRAALIPHLVRAAWSVGEAGHGLLIWDGWRPRSLQTTLHNEYRTRLATTSGLTGARLDRVVADYVTDPERADPPPPHITGGAVDLTLCDLASGDPRDMGSEFDELTARSRPTYYDDATELGDMMHASLRQTLNAAMTEVGFVRLSSEWWHFEFGTRLWAEAHAGEALFGATMGPSD